MFLNMPLALDYLLSLADPPNVKSVSMLSDNNYTAKIADFGASPLISSCWILSIL
jgi:hypothetical protein